MLNKIKENLGYILITIFFILFMLALIYVVTYREQAKIFVKDKYWHFYLDVRYTEWHTRQVQKTRESCTGFGENKKCRRDTYWDTETYQDTHIVCKGERDGKELPEKRPKLTCEKSGNQFEHQDISYHLVYDKDGQQKVSTFPKALWDILKINKWNKVEQDFFGNITNYIGE